MKAKTHLIFVLGLLMLFACKKENNPVEVGTDPVIESINLRYKWNSVDSTRQVKIEVKTTDPQGFSNLNGVFMEVTQVAGNMTVFSDSLYDDGAYFQINDGDVFAGDGVFSNRYTATQILSGSGEGEYKFTFTAFDKDGNESQKTEQTSLFGPNVRPEIIEITGIDSLYSGTTPVIFEVAVFDSDGVDDVIRVYFDVKDSLNSPIETIDLFNDGDFANHGDLFADDSLYSIKLDSTFGAERKGVYHFWFHLEDSFNEQNLLTPIFHLYIENEVGVIVNTVVPDTITRPQDLGLYLTAKDPQGLADVDSVYFLLEKPDGSFGGGGAKFDLQDNGDDFYGDLVSGDGIYSKIISIAASNDPGLYIFHFYMRDKVGHLTPVTKDSILVN